MHYRTGHSLATKQKDAFATTIDKVYTKKELIHEV